MGIKFPSGGESVERIETGLESGPYWDETTSPPDPGPSPMSTSADRPLELQRREFASRRFLAMPLAGTLAWSAVLVGGLYLPTQKAGWLVFIATGMIAYLGMAISRFTGENFLDKSRPKNVFDALFFAGMGEALLAYAIAIPFYTVDPTSVPLAVGVLTGMMWLPFGWIVQHWIGLFHGIVRSLSLCVLWYLFPTQRFVVLPAAIIVVYAVTIVVLERRWRAGRAADRGEGRTSLA